MRIADNEFSITFKESLFLIVLSTFKCNNKGKHKGNNNIYSWEKERVFFQCS